ncbi:unnamed protein product [Notodromas monacha]|uniref:Methyltransferase type 11 domain-containing protein n=1 Tax=Notodromas monacha TaxID=399045 RepID=A0A7R9BIP7_9CRUS|nr:unnamed protein product [Notodromas monacha]CAG0914838.1 unnamed protein product [Notodromas monacha]
MTLRLFKSKSFFMSSTEHIIKPGIRRRPTAVARVSFVVVGDKTSAEKHATNTRVPKKRGVFRERETKDYKGPLLHALDVGCGNGYSSKIWSNHFKNVTGIDVNPAKVSDARRHDPPPNIRFAVAPAECIPVQEEEVTIIVSKASHWFDLTDFFSEAERVLMPHGVVALYNACLTPMDFPDLPPEENRKLKEVVNWADNELVKHWPTARATVIEEFANVNIPFSSEAVLVRDGSIYQEVTLSSKDLLQYILSWVAFYRLKAVEGKEAANKFTEEITKRHSTSQHQGPSQIH